jgi:hypothetical protein
MIAGIKSVEAKYPGLENFMIHWAEGLPPQEFKEQLRWFANGDTRSFAHACSRPFASHLICEERGTE